MVTDDFLPPREPSDNPAAAKSGGSATKTFLVWFVLIVIAVAMYNIFAAAPSSRAQPPTPASTWLLAIVKHGWPFAAITLFVVWVRRQLRGGNTLQERLESGTLALANGDAAGAVARYREVERLYAKQTTYLASVRLYRALAELRAGQLGAAVETLISVERTPGFVFGSDVRTSATVWLAISFALRGDVERASRWLADVDRRLRRAQLRIAPASLRSLAEALLWLRRDDPTVAARVIDRDRAAIEESLAVAYVRVVWLVRAFAAARLAGPRDEAAAAEPWLRLLRGAPAASLGWVATEWPELRTFMTAHDLV